MTSDSNTAPMRQRQPARPALGIVLMIAAGLCFVGVTGIVRYLGTDVPAAQSAFVRFLWGVVLLLPTLWPLLRRPELPPGAWPLVAGRGALHATAVLLWFYAMARIPVAEVTAIGYLTPVCVTLGAALLLGERVAMRRLVAIGVALAGAAIVLRPGLRELSSGHMSQLAAAVFFAGSYLAATRLSRILPAGTVVALMSLTVALFLAPFAAAVWVPITPVQVLWLGLVAALATIGHYCMTRAFAHAPVSVTQPVTFLQLVWATALGAVAFGEGIDPFVLLGGGVIIAAVSYIAWREAVIRRQPVTPPAEATKL